MELTLGERQETIWLFRILKGDRCYGRKKGVARVTEVMYAGMRGQILTLNSPVRVGLRENRFKDLKEINTLVLWVIRRKLSRPREQLEWRLIGLADRGLWALRESGVKNNAKVFGLSRYKNWTPICRLWSPQSKDKLVTGEGQESGLHIIFKYLVRHPSRDRVGNWMCTSGDQSVVDFNLEYLKPWDQVW